MKVQQGSDETALLETQDLGEWKPGDHGPPRGRLGRFTIIDTVGHGAMGIVVAAYDPDLDRKVAIKVLRASASSSTSSSKGTERLLREARAMARLAHPRVVTVHEVGTVGDEVFVAMEFCAGGTLREWCSAAGEARPWRAVVDRFAQAGEGLAAAHDAGMVHRDFKPENVLLTKDGEVRVADFGMVGIRDATPAVAAPDGDAPLEPLTRTGALLGTPAYMSPEQHLRETVGPAADQFAFCVALWEVLFRRWPFAGDTYGALSASVIAGAVVEPPAGDVPGWLRAVLRRGLSPRPGERWPSMRALLAALARDPDAERRRRARRAAAAAGLALLGGLAAFGLWRGVSPGDTPCRGMEDKLAGVWDEGRARDVRAAFIASGRPYASDTYDRVARRLDDHARDWVSARVEACRATRVRGEQSEELLDLRMGCFDRELAETRALVDVLAAPGDPTVVDRAAQAASLLRPAAECADREALRAAVPPPADAAVRARVAELRARLAVATAMEDTGRYSDGLAAAKEIAAGAAPLGYAPLLAEALARRGSLEKGAGDPAGARATLEQAVLAAADARDDALAARVWTLLIEVIGDPGAKPDEALRLRPSAEAAVRRAGRAPELEAGLLRSVGLAQKRKGLYDEARVSLERALEMRQRALPADHPDVAVSTSNLGAAYAALGQYEKAKQLYEQSLAIFEKNLGPEHPQVASALNNIGGALEELGRPAEALLFHQRALAIRERAFGPESMPVVSSLNNLGNVYESLRRYEEARRFHERALATVEKSLGPEHPRVAMSLNNLGIVLARLGLLEEARRNHERALAIHEKALGPEHPDVAYSLTSLGDVLRKLGRPAEARPHLLRALAIREKALGPDHSEVAAALIALARVDLALARRDEARALAERALRIREPRGGLAVAECHLVLAMAMPAGPAAVAMARQARDEVGKAAEPGTELLEEVDEFLRRGLERR